MKITPWLAGSIMLLVAGTAQAFTAAPGSLAAAPGASIIQVRGGCGYGEHRGPLGGCRLNNGPRGAIRQALTGAPRGCPPGKVRGPLGRCHF